MARVKYLDEMGRYGELPLTSVKAGDLVKLLVIELVKA